MKVLFVIPQPFFRERGSPIRALHQLRELCGLGHPVDVLCFPFGTDLSVPGMRIVRIKSLPGISDVPVGFSLPKLLLDVRLFFKAWSMCRRNRYDLIQAVEEAAFFCPWLKRLFRCRFVYNMDSLISDQLRYTRKLTFRPLLKLAERLERHTARNADCVVTVGPALTDVVHGWAPGVEVLQLEDSPMDEEFAEDREGAGELRARLGLGDRPVVVYTGNFISYQGVELLVRAAGAVAAVRQDVRIVMAGGTPTEVEEMRRLAQEVGANGTCVFAGSRPTAEMPAFLTLASVLVSPRTGGTNPPLKLYAYMQSGRPLVVTRLRTHTQALDETCAILADPTPEAFGRGILQALEDPVASAELAHRAADRLKKLYGLDVFRAKVRGSYQKLAAT